VDYFFTNPAGHLGETPEILRVNFPLTQLITLIFLGATAGADALFSFLFSL
jgi:hypothetical protein